VTVDLLTVVLAFLGAVAGGGAGSAAIQARQSNKDRELKLRADIRKEFLDLLAQAHGKPRDGRPGVGLVEQVGALYMMQGLALENTWLRPPVVMALHEFVMSEDFNHVHRSAAAMALELLQDQSRDLVYRNGRVVTSRPLAWWISARAARVRSRSNRRTEPEQNGEGT